MHTHTVCHKSVQLVIFSSPEAQNSREIVQSGLMWRTSVCTQLLHTGNYQKRFEKETAKRRESAHLSVLFYIHISDIQVQVCQGVAEIRSRCLDTVLLYLEMWAEVEQITFPSMRCYAQWIMSTEKA